MNNHALARCQGKRDDCFAYIKGGQCRCLRNTDFNGKLCPFYKTRKEAGFIGLYEEAEYDG